MQCKKTTQKGKQCSRNAVPGGAEYCTQHGGKPSLVTPKGMPDIPKENAPKIVKRLQKLIAKGPKPDDGAGSIYIYRLAREPVELNYFKVGMTERSVDLRMTEWEAEHKDRVICVARYVVTAGVKHKERVIHLYLNHCRMNRYPVGARFLSKWYSSGVVIQDRDAEKIDEKERLVAKKKHTEWFCCEQDTLLELVHSLTL